MTLILNLTNNIDCNGSQDALLNSDDQCLAYFYYESLKKKCCVVFEPKEVLIIPASLNQGNLTASESTK